MASLTFSGALLPLPEVVPASSAAPQGPGFFTRFFNAMMESRARSAARELARHRALMAPSVATLFCEQSDLPFEQE